MNKTQAIPVVLLSNSVFEQVGGSKSSADVGLFNFGGDELGLRTDT